MFNSKNEAFSESTSVRKQAHIYNSTQITQLIGTWGEEALEKAKEENKLLVISIGYYACHWCQEEETFTDTLVAKLMNDGFVSIKVDREERPDIDEVYKSC